MFKNENFRNHTFHFRLFFILKCFYKIKLIKINDYCSIHMQFKTWFKKSFLSTIALIFILMIVADFSTFAIYVAGADLGGGCRGCAPPPWDDLRFSNTTGIL